MKRIIIFAMVFILCGCGKGSDEKNLDIAAEQYVGNYLFNTNEEDCIEISGEDLLNHKNVNISTVEEDGRDIELVIKREDYGPAIAMDVFFGENGIDLVTYLKKSTDEWFGALEDFYYQLSCYDFDNDGEKEIIVAAGNKKDILELYILRLEYNNPDFSNAQILKSINSGSKVYVNEKKEICVMDSQGQISTYSLNNMTPEKSDVTLHNKKYKKEMDVGNYLFNADKMETVEISGKDLLQRKKAEMSTEIVAGTKIDLAIKLDDYNFGFSLIIFSENGGIDMSSNFEKSVKKGCAPKEDFYYQMASYDFDHDGKKEIVIAGGNKKDTLELCVFQLDLDLDFDKNEPKKVFEINDGYKSYVNEKDEICVIDYKNDISVYSYKESGNEK